MFCIQCGENNPDQATLCRRCGTQLEKPAVFPSVDSSNVLLPSSPSQIMPVSSEQLSFKAIPGIPATPQSPQQFSFEQSGMSDAPTLRAQYNMPDPPLPPQEAQNWETFGPNQPFEQFSFS